MKKTKETGSCQKRAAELQPRATVRKLSRSVAEGHRRTAIGVHGLNHRPEVIRKGKSGKPTEFGKMVKLQEAESRLSLTTPSMINVPATANC